MTEKSLFAQVIDPASRADPYPLYARLREQPITREDDGTYVVSTYAEIRSLLKDPRVSSQDMPKPKYQWTWNPIKDFILNPLRAAIMERHRPFIFRDPPDHDALRAAVLQQFSPDRVKCMRARIRVIVGELIDKMRGRETIDVVESLAYPLPVTVICELLGVPAEDAHIFHPWSTILTEGLEPYQRATPQSLQANMEAYEAITAYLNALIKQRRKHPQDDILSALATYKDKKSRRLNQFDLIATAILLLVGGHETTVNLIANGTLMLMRHPELFARLREDPTIALGFIDEIMRFDPPGHFRTRKTLAEVDIMGTRIPKGAPIVLLFAAANRDPKQFRDADRFDPDRTDNQHLGFGAGLHYCIGAQLARMEAEEALVALSRRLVDPRLVMDPPPYRSGASLRGPERLDLRIAGVVG